MAVLDEIDIEGLEEGFGHGVDGGVVALRERGRKYLEEDECSVAEAEEPTEHFEHFRRAGGEGGIAVYEDQLGVGEGLEELQVHGLVLPSSEGRGSAAARRRSALPRASKR